MNYIDFHVHIDYYKNSKDIFDYYNKNKIYTLFVTNLPEAYEKCFLNINTSKYVKIALGYNPQFAGIKQFNKSIFDKYFDTTKYIGEVGLDFSRNFIKHKKSQLETFDYIAYKAGKGNKILSIHSRNAEKDVLNILQKNNVKFAVFHWYSGIDTINKIVDLGYYFSINYSMLNSKKGRIIISHIPIDRVLIETDGPFVKYKQKPIFPNDLPHIYNSFSKVFGNREFNKIVFNNLKKLLYKNQSLFVQS
ncbi:MAG: TatD DNase family protein [Rikenellaceae bacterium]|nr:TatD DNase family protein [Rikenellaceae bacterium]